ncbi:MAG TPA: glycosyltransferase [Patescibacteria group bacterium]|nr:glycosyltransferase [Patescibacteria group bacterium]
MKISLCVTVFNEESSVGPLLDSLFAQSKKADEIVIVDGGSTDKTVEIINHYQKKHGNIRLLKERCSRARGRNLSVEVAKNDIIAMTDAGCVAHKDWLEKLTAPFSTPEVDISAGFYKMVGETQMQKAESIFLGVLPSNFDVTFLPSTRSIAFRKNVWEDVGGFPDEEKNSAEDTYFNYSALKAGMKYARVKNAIVEWGMPETIGEFYRKIKSYAMWDARTKIWIFPKKGLTSHNIKALSILLRYLLGFSLLVLIFTFGTPPLVYLLICIFVYFAWAFRKVFLEFREVRIALWGPVLQIVCDLAVIAGFLTGVFRG